MTLLTYQPVISIKDYENGIAILFAVIFVMVYFQIIQVSDFKKDILENQKRTVIILNIQDKIVEQGKTNNDNIVMMSKIQGKIIVHVNNTKKVLGEHLKR